MKSVIYYVIFLHVCIITEVPPRFYIDLQDFPRNPNIFYLTLQNRKSFFCVFWTCRNLPSLKRSGTFCQVNIVKGRRIHAEGGHQEGNEASSRPHGVSKMSHRTMGGPSASLIGFFTWFSHSLMQLELKSSLHIPIIAVSQGCGRKKRSHKK
jgi:hypothetical protein